MSARPTRLLLLLSLWCYYWISNFRTLFGQASLLFRLFQNWSPSTCADFTVNTSNGHGLKSDRREKNCSTQSTFSFCSYYPEPRNRSTYRDRKPGIKRAYMEALPKHVTIHFPWTTPADLKEKSKDPLARMSWGLISFDPAIRFKFPFSWPFLSRLRSSSGYIISWKLAAYIRPTKGLGVFFLKHVHGWCACWLQELSCTTRKSPRIKPCSAITIGPILLAFRKSSSMQWMMLNDTITWILWLAGRAGGGNER